MPLADKRTIEIHTDVASSAGKAQVDPSQLYRLLAALLERCLNALDHGSALTVQVAPHEVGMLAVSATAAGHVHLPNITSADPEIKEKELALAESMAGKLEFPALERDGAPLFVLHLPSLGE